MLHTQHKYKTIKTAESERVKTLILTLSKTADIAISKSEKSRLFNHQKDSNSKSVCI